MEKVEMAKLVKDMTPDELSELSQMISKEKQSRLNQRYNCLTAKLRCDLKLLQEEFPMSEILISLNGDNSDDEVVDLIETDIESIDFIM